MTSHPCPRCDYCIDAATNPKKPSQHPKPGDLSICVNCAGLLMFDKNSIPIAHDEALLDAGTKATILQYRRALLEVKA